MPNDYFSFKQFTVQQDKSAMKVCTDACLFGAWAAGIIQNSKCNIQTILDVGSGTGLLSLMLAQKTDAHIDAVEVDNPSFEQATENFNKSPWKDRLRTCYADIKEFSFKHKYDVIISNPPFFEDSLKSGEDRKNTAKHSTQLSFEALAMVVSNNLSNEGTFFILLPYAAFKDFEIIANQHNLFVKNIVHVKQTSNHSYFRSMAMLTKIKCEISEVTIINIRQENNEYSEEFEMLLNDYYL